MSHQGGTPTSETVVAPAPSATKPAAASPEFSATSTPTATPTKPDPVAQAKPGTALAAIARLTVKGRAPKTGYTRAQFGQAW
jgi:hypothetical protein